MAFAGDVCEEMRDIAEVWLFGTDAAQKRYVGRHDKWQRCPGSSREAPSNATVRSVSDAGVLKSSRKDNACNAVVYKGTTRKERVGC
jgi:hypothetical protein